MTLFVCEKMSCLLLFRLDGARQRSYHTRTRWLARFSRSTVGMVAVRDFKRMEISHENSSQSTITKSSTTIYDWCHSEFFNANHPNTHNLSYLYKDNFVWFLLCSYQIVRGFGLKLKEIPRWTGLFFTCHGEMIHFKLSIKWLEDTCFQRVELGLELWMKIKFKSPLETKIILTGKSQLLCFTGRGKINLIA